MEVLGEADSTLKVSQLRRQRVERLVKGIPKYHMRHACVDISSPLIIYPTPLFPFSLSPLHSNILSGRRFTVLLNFPPKHMWVRAEGRWFTFLLKSRPNSR